ncbi:hypothetical protein ACJ72_05139 [Emergomyces africanus]|uniref:U4/U6.U5 small nuclear ribonucleoprotein 27kDa protein domain-containing protein n=1 Tax=Emergomyces africanus TaxID=1955775 RepID=A0A1B7NUS4_9EURO|nr:hypothetical protein ACJ72_05139 [Emergomyces africanus]
MAEPPAKRARRTDSSAMWEMNDANLPQSDRGGSKEIDGGASKREPSDKDDLKRGNMLRDERRQRSRSRDKDDWRRDRSRSRDRRDRSWSGERRDRDRVRDRDGRRERGRSGSRERYNRRGDYGKSARYRGRGRDKSWSRSRSPTRSPARNGTSTSTTRPRRSRSPPRPRGPKSDRRDAPLPRDQARESGKVGVNGTSDSRRQGKIKSQTQPTLDSMDVDIDGENTDDLDQLIRKTMGFSSFRTTQNTKVPGNNVYGVRKEKKTEYRQYMNRQGGFNRPLSPTR